MFSEQIIAISVQCELPSVLLLFVPKIFKGGTVYPLVLYLFLSVSCYRGKVGGRLPYLVGEILPSEESNTLHFSFKLNADFFEG